MSELLPCPHCGEATGVSVREGSTYRWLLIGGNCGCCEIEVGKRDRALACDHSTNLVAAHEAWNRRTPPIVGEDARDKERRHADAIGNHAYASSDKHLSGYRLTLGFDTLEQVQDAHTAVVYFGQRLAGEKP